MTDTLNRCPFCHDGGEPRKQPINCSPDRGTVTCQKCKASAHITVWNSRIHQQRDIPLEVSDDMLIPNLVMMVGRLCYRLKNCPDKTEGNSSIIEKTMDYLKRNGLQKNALRYEESRNEIEVQEGGDV